MLVKEWYKKWGLHLIMRFAPRVGFAKENCVPPTCTRIPKKYTLVLKNIGFYKIQWCL